MSSIPALLLLLQVLGIRAADKYDAIIVGGGTSGCVLAQTLVEKGKDVLLLERGGRPVKDATRKETAFNALVNNPCIEVFDGDGVPLATGRCLGGATTYNQGVYIEEEPDFLNHLAWLTDNRFDPETISEAYTYARERLAPLNRAPAGSKQETYITELIRATEEATGLPIANVTPGSFQVEDGIFRTHSYIQADKRYSTDQILDESNPHLNLKLHADVTEIVYDYSTQPFTAVCVKTRDLDQYCVKEGTGRIYLSSGAIHTPALLMKNGIGPGGNVVDNEKVGQDLSDKPLFIVTSFFKPGVVFGDFGSLLEIAFTKLVDLSSGNQRRVLVEEAAMGKDGDLIDLARFFRVLLPRYLRFSIVNDTVDALLGFCNDAWINYGLLGQAVSVACTPFIPFYQASCTANTAGFAALIAEPSSKGSVKVKQDGKIVVEPRFLDTDDDTEALGASIRLAASVIPKRQGPTTAAQPGDVCPEAYNVYQNLFATASFMFDYIGYPTSSIGPNWVEPDLKTKNDLQIGRKASNYIVSAYHFAGTAALGNVVDGNFKVIGVDGLYVADASVVPTTPRVNMGATAMMIGRLAGVVFD